MRISYPLLYLIALILTIALGWGCNLSEGANKDVDDDLLYGRWNTLLASRDGKLTQTLQESYFVFKKPDTLINNLNRKERVYNFQLQDKVISQLGEHEYNFQILKLNKDTLVLNTKIRDYDLNFLLLRDTLVMR